MKPRRPPWKRLLLLLVGICLVGLALLPWLIGDTSAFGGRVAAKLEQWTGGEVRLTGLKLHYFPRISIKGELTISNPENAALPTEIHCEAARISFSLPHLILGRLVIQSINLVEPEITFEQPSERDPQGWYRAEGALLKLLGKRPFHVLRMQNGTVRFVSPTATSRIESLSLKLDLGDEDERTDGYGSFVWKGEPVRFTYATGLDAETIRTAASDTPSPISVNVESAPFSATLDGTSRFGPDFAMEGAMTARIADLRDFLHWIDMADVEGPGLEDITVEGDFHFTDMTLIFEDGRYGVDGNAASGLMAVALGGARPRLEATLAFDNLSLDPYLAPMEDGAEPNGEPGSDAAATPPDASAPNPPQASSDPPAEPIFDWPLLKIADVDLRFSANTIAARDIELSGGAFTLAVQDSVIVGDIADLELCKGTASARFTLDLTAPTRDADLAARLEEVDIAPCLQLLLVEMPVQGRADLKGQFKTTGQSWSDFMERVTGDFQLSVRDGSLPVEIGSPMSDEVPMESVGWATAPVTSFASLNSDCRIAAPHVWCQNFSMETPQGPVSGSGKIDIAGNRLEWFVSMQTGLNPDGGEPAGKPPRKITLRGPIAEPVIRRDAPTPRPDLSAPSEPVTPN